ncbi:MAG: hypothetical protein Q8P18_11395 [Pseudomonadota bacterium]|nr:hypothetical protein [Pseudomonadota bacterium]
MLILSLLLACTGAHEDTAVEDAATLTFLDPVDGDTVPAGDVAVSVIVDGFTLEAPAKHNEGAPEGYITVTVDGAVALTTAETQFTVTLADAGSHTIGAELTFADGDPLDPAVGDEITITVE